MRVAVRSAAAAALALTLASCADGGVTSPPPAPEPRLSTAPATPPSELFLSEYVEGSSNHKAVELYNGTGAPIDLAAGGYNVQMYFNGSASAGLTVNLTGTVAAGDVFVLAHASADAVILAQADQTNGSGWFNGDDAVVLRKGTAVIDVLGQIGSDPGTEWGSGLASTADNTLRRKPAVCRGDTNGADAFDPAAEWDGFAQNAFDGLGSHVVNCGTPPPPPPPPPPGGSPLVINEILINASGDETLREWFEVRNTGAAALDLRGWTIVSGRDSAHTIAASVVVPAGGYAVLARSGDTASNGGVRADYVYSQGVAAGHDTVTFANSDDWLLLRDTAGVVADSVSWAGSPFDASRALGDPAADNADVGGSAWFTSSVAWACDGDKGTPGRLNTDTTPPVCGGTGEVARVTIAFDNDRARLPAGFVMGAFASAYNGSGTRVATQFTWSTSDTSVATVDGFGNLTARRAGTVTIVATAANGVSGSRTLSVLPADAPTSAEYLDHREFGTPTDADPSDDLLIVRDEYALSYNAARGGANWIAWNLNATQFGSAERCECFTPDPALPTGVYAVTDRDYTGSGYSRGHMVMSEQRTATLQENAATFYLTNILPQAQANNGGPWLDFENHLSDLARGGKEVYVIAGGEYAPNAPTLNNANRVAIPSWTWKIAVVLERREGLDDVQSLRDAEVLAIRTPNRTEPGVPGSVSGISGQWESYRTTVDQIETATGYDFLAALPDWIEAAEERGAADPALAVMDVQPATISLSTTAIVNVVLYSSASFDAAAVDVANTRLVPNGTGTGVAVNKRGTAYNTSLRDFNGDGRADRLLAFRTAELVAAGLTTSSTRLVLTDYTSASTWEARDAALPVLKP